MQQHLLQLGVEIITAHGLDKFDGTNAELSCVYTERVVTIAADAIVTVTAREPLDSLYTDLVELTDSRGDNSNTPSIKKIGDCDAPAIIAAAVFAGHRYARELEADPELTDVIRQDRLFDPA